MSAPSPVDRSAREIRDLVASGKLPALEVCEAAFARVDALDDTLKAFLTLDPEGARAAARATDAKRAKGEPVGALSGVPVALKDNLTTRGTRTTCGSRILETYVPPYDATVVTRLRAAGATIVGKTNMDEFAMGSSTENSAFFPTRNPWDPECVPGGSSGGSAASVASGMAVLGLGSDTGGSVRQPGALTGIVAFKPTYGRISRYGLVAFASSLDQIGPMARDVDGCRLLYEVLAGHDPMDSTSLPHSDGFAPHARGGDSAPARAADGARGLRIGVPSKWLDREGMDPEVAAFAKKSAAWFESMGATVRSVNLPDPDHGVAAYYLVATAEASSNLARYDGIRYGLRVSGDGSLGDLYEKTRDQGFGTEVKRRILLGTYGLSAGYYDAYYLRAQKFRGYLSRAFDAMFREVDLLLVPTSPTPAFRLGAKTENPLAMYLCDVFTIFANLTGGPAISVPVGLTKVGLPVGMQLVADRMREDLLFRGAAALEDAAEFLGTRPGAAPGAAGSSR